METPEDETPEAVAQPLADDDQAGLPDLDQGEDEDGDQVPLGLRLGPPFAISSGAADDESVPLVLLKRDSPADRAANPGHAVQGCIATVGCPCGQPFIINLLSEKVSRCPGCGERYSSILVVAAEDDDQAMMEVLEHLRLVNNPEEFDQDEQDLIDEENARSPELFPEAD
jgi:hypothetical protein